MEKIHVGDVLKVLESGNVERVLPTPTGMTVTRNDLDGSGTQRDELGKLHRDRLRAGVYTVEVEWDGLSVSELAALTKAFVEHDELTVTFFDLTTCSHVTAQMYAANPSASVTTPGEYTDDMKCSYSVSLIQF